MDLQTEIFNLTEHKLNSSNVVVTCKTNSLGRGVDEKVKIIDGKITFTFKTCDFGKTINSLQISMNNGQVKQDFENKEFAGKMYTLFVARERQILQSVKDKQQQAFFKNFQENIK